MTAQSLRNGVSRVIATLDQTSVRLQTLARRVSDHPSACVLLFHSVGGLADAPYLVRTGLPSMAVGEFHRLCAYFARRRFQSLTLRELMQHHRAGHVPPRTVVFTFDDGFRDNFTVAADILRSFHMKATFYVVSDWVGRETPAWLHQASYYCDTCPAAFVAEVQRVSGPRWQRFINLFGATVPQRDALLVFRQALLPDEQTDVLQTLLARRGDPPVSGRLYLNWQELAELARAGMEIGAHGVSHRSLWALPDRDAAREIADSGTYLREKLNTEITSYSYPFGHFLAQHPDMLSAAGYENAVTVRRNRNDARAGLYELGRYGINSTVSWHDLGCMCLDRTADSIARFKQRLGRSCRYLLANPESGLVTMTPRGPQYDMLGATVAFASA